VPANGSAKRQDLPEIDVAWRLGRPLNSRVRAVLRIRNNGHA
jgi:hypothetical protein